MCDSVQKMYHTSKLRTSIKRQAVRQRKKKRRKERKNNERRGAERKEEGREQEKSQGDISLGLSLLSLGAEQSFGHNCYLTSSLRHEPRVQCMSVSPRFSLNRKSETLAHILISLTDSVRQQSLAESTSDSRVSCE